LELVVNEGVLRMRLKKHFIENSEEANFLTAIYKEHLSNIRDKELVEAFNNIGEKEIYNIVKKNKSESITSNWILNNINNCDKEHWDNILTQNSLKMNTMALELKLVGKGLKENNINFMLLENASVAIPLELPLSCQQYGDFDIWIDGQNMIKKIGMLLNNMGYMFLNQQSSRTIYVKDFGDFEIRLNFQYDLVAREIPYCKYPLFSNFFSNATFNSNINSFILTPEYNLYALCMHNAAHLFYREPGLKLHFDIALLLSKQKINWDKFEELVNNYGNKINVIMALKYTEDLFDIKIPSYLIKINRINKLKVKIITRLLKNKISISKRKNNNKLITTIIAVLICDSIFFTILNYLTNILKIQKKLPS
jgi:hypothetical protein